MPERTQLQELLTKERISRRQFVRILTKNQKKG